MLCVVYENIVYKDIRAFSAIEANQKRTFSSNLESSKWLFLFFVQADQCVSQKGNLLELVYFFVLICLTKAFGDISE